MRLKVRLIIFSIVCIAVSIYFFIIAGKWLVKQDNLKEGDAIVLLMGSIADRVLEASDLYSQGFASEVILVETGNETVDQFVSRGVEIVSPASYARDLLIDLGIPQTSITLLPGYATSTQMEAITFRDYFSNQTQIDTILIVTSSEHTRRAFMIFNSALKKHSHKMTIISCPSHYTNFHAEKWWSSRDGIETVFLEYVKLLNFFLFEKRKL